MRGTTALAHADQMAFGFEPGRPSCSGSRRTIRPRVRDGRMSDRAGRHNGAGYRRVARENLRRVAPISLPRWKMDKATADGAATTTVAIERIRATRRAVPAYLKNQRADMSLKPWLERTLTTGVCSLQATMFV